MPGEKIKYESFPSDIRCENKTRCKEIREADQQGSVNRVFTAFRSPSWAYRCYPDALDRSLIRIKF